MTAIGAENKIARNETLKDKKIIDQRSGSALNNNEIACIVGADRSLIVRN